MTLPPLFSCRFPTYIKDCSNNEVDVLWYHPNFSQSRYPPGQERSEACTLICLLVAVRIARENVLICDIESCPKLNIIIAEAMIEGNATHAWLIEERLLSDPYLSTEEALKYGGNSLNTLREWKFNVFHEEIETSLYKNINIFLHNWYRAPKSHTLFMLLITCGRTVLFIFQGSIYKVLNTIARDKYANYSSANKLWKCTMQTTIDRLESLCNWYTKDILQNCYNTQANKYELAFLYSHGAHCNNHRGNIQNSCKRSKIS